MSLFVASLNSGSNGNCYYIGNEKDAVLVDAGISCRETERRMIRLGLPLKRVRAIFISHEHTDPTRGAEVLSRKYRIPVYITESTYLHGRMKLEPQLRRAFKAGIPVENGSLKVLAFPKSHDASEPHSFIISSYGLTAGVFTDIGNACDQVKLHLGLCHAAFLESNYDEGMLNRGPYPLYLKRRIRGEKGHLSNDQALELFNNYRASWMQLLILAHLSAENNDPRLVSDLFRRNACGVQIEVASRHEETAVFRVDGKNEIHTGEEEKEPILFHPEFFRQAF